MGKLALTAKITHVPSMYLSELDGPQKGTRQAAIDGHVEIGKRCRALGVDTIVVFDTHWLVNAGYHINCAPHFKGTYTSNELPHFISNMPFEYDGNPGLGRLLAKTCNDMGVATLAHDATSLAPEYGTLVPMRYMNADCHFKVISVSALCMVHYLEDSFTSAETKAYRDHVSLGVTRGKRMALSTGALQVLAQHHELADGTGFPGRIALDAMTPGSRLVALVNRYDNLCNPGPRGVALTPHEAVSVLFAQSRSKFDMPILSGFIRMMGVYPAGSVVQLTDERYALVMQVNSLRPLKPRVLVHDAKVPRDEALLLDLEQHPDLGIRRSLQAAKLPPAALTYLAPRPRVTYYFDMQSSAGRPADADASAPVAAPAL